MCRDFETLSWCSLMLTWAWVPHMRCWYIIFGWNDQLLREAGRALRVSSRLISPTRFTPALQKQGRPKLEAKLKMKAKIQAIKEARKAERANTSILTMAQIPRSWLVIEISIGNGRQQLVLHIPISQDPPHTWACCSKLRAAGLHGLFTKNSWTKIPPGRGL